MCVNNNTLELPAVTEDKNNGLITKIWGPPGWIFCHSVTFGYPLNPTDSQKATYRQFFTTLGDVLPCRFCRDSYNEYISKGETKLTDSVFENRQTLTKWFYDIHNAVNIKLGIKYGVSYNGIVDRYESFRAQCGKADEYKKGCITPLNYKAYSFRKLNQIDCPIISIKVAKYFETMAKSRNVNKKILNFYNYVVTNNLSIDQIKNSNIWERRNKICRKIINKMRENGIPSLETNGKWINTPTLCELELIMLFCSNLNNDEINNIVHKIKKDEYYLI